VSVGWFLPLLYVFFHRHRTVASIDRTIRLVKRLARLPHSRRPYDAPEIGRIVMAVERSVGISDCYPRALVTAYLCMTARLSCEVTVGILAPSANMHAWCSTGGAIPYEPKPEHWFYSPLVVFDVP
jgi:Transglutaminase-like superfamily